MVEDALRWGAQIVALVAEAAGVVIAAIGIVRALVSYVVDMVRERGAPRSQQTRLDLGRALALSLELLLAADIVRTAIAPTWEEIGQLAAIVAIRTVLNFFLQREINQEQDMLQREVEVRNQKLDA
ncbi:MAG TPA: DUF1622 domain-containing protein [Chloroflexia bacterium]|jgi:uncharacterized membrane protein